MKITARAVALLCLATLTGCGAASDQHDAPKKGALAGALALGRRVGSPLTVSDDGAGLALTGGAVAAATIEAVNGAPRRVTFDTAAAESAAYSLDQLNDIATDLARSVFAPYASAEWQIALRTAAPRQLPGGLAVVSFTVSVADLPVRDASIEIFFNRRADGAYVLSELASRHAVVPLAGLDLKAEADGGFLGALGLEAPRYEMASARAVIFPREAATDVYTYEVAREVTALDTETGETLVVTIGAHNGGAVLEAYSNRSQANGVNAEVFLRSYRSKKAAYPASFATVTANAQKLALDALGQTPTAFTGAANLVLTSPRVVIGSLQSPYTIAVTAPDEEAVDVDVTGNDLNALNAYTAVQKVNAFARRHLTEKDAQILQRPVAVTLNVAGSCNAFYTNTSISLYRAGGGCSNMAVVNDVISHEWGHGLDDYTGTDGGISDGAFSEGIGDIVAGYLAQDSNMGSGFFTGNGNGIRSLKNTFKYPDDRGEVHDEGQIIAGAFWDMHAGFMERYGDVKGAFKAEELFFRHLLTADTYRDSYDTVLRLDDDDANPATPSPNRCLINAAFAAHGLATKIMPCADDPKKFGYKADATLALAILEATDDRMSLMAAAGGAARSMTFCVGESADCDDLKAKGWQPLKLDGTLANRVAFVTPAPVEIADGARIWIAAFDESGALLGRRAMKLAGR